MGRLRRKRKKSFYDPAEFGATLQEILGSITKKKAAGRRNNIPRSNLEF
jgi:hypothetical protein